PDVIGQGVEQRAERLDHVGAIALAVRVHPRLAVVAPQGTEKTKRLGAENSKLPSHRTPRPSPPKTDSTVPHSGQSGMLCGSPRGAGARESRQLCRPRRRAALRLGRKRRRTGRSAERLAGRLGGMVRGENQRQIDERATGVSGSRRSWACSRSGRRKSL